VSGFLGRLAARAVGESAAARPRVPSPFPLAGDAEIVETTEEVAGDPPPARPAPPARFVQRPPQRVGSTQPPGTRAVAPQPAGTRGRSTAPVQPGARPVDPAAQQQQPQHLVPEAPALEADPGPRGPAGEAGETRLLRRHEREIVTARPASATPPPAAGPLAPARAPAEQARAGQPPVRVHIGRLEVRASLPEAPREPVSREQPPASALSLADYLRGRREAAS
jgi:hypothetical protein